MTDQIATLEQMVRETGVFRCLEANAPPSAPSAAMTTDSLHDAPSAGP